MINGVIEIVAAVLFAVVFLFTEMNTIWLWVAGFYLVCGCVNLVVHTVKNKRKLRAAEKQAEKNTQQAARQMEKSTELMETKTEPDPAEIGNAGNDQ